MQASTRLAGRTFLLVTLALFAANCGGDSSGTAPDPNPDPPVATSIMINPASPSLTALGATVQLTAAVRDQFGNAMTGAAVQWSSSDPAVASVSASGLVTALAVGNVTVTASSGSATQNAALAVTQAVSSVVVTPPDAVIAPSETVQLEAQALDANGNPVAGTSLSWTSGDSNVATVSSAGLVSGVAAGTTMITATADGVEGSSMVTVSPPPVTSVTVAGRSRVKVGDVYQYTVTATLADGTVVNRPVTWGLLDESQGTITQSGQLQPLAAGTISILMTIDGSVWTVDLLAYDWRVLSGPAASFLVLDADVEITNTFGNSEYPELVLACDATTQGFHAWVSTERFVTASGLVTYRYDEGSFVHQTWLEIDDFSTLAHPGPTNVHRKNFAIAMANARMFSFAFSEFRGPAQATLFRVTGLNTLLPPLLALCPRNAVVAGAPGLDQTTALSEWRALNPTSAVPGGLHNAREARLGSGTESPAGFPELVLPQPPTEELRATRRRH